MTDQNRHPAGVPTGGQFAASARPEAEVALDPAPAPVGPADWTVHTDIDRLVTDWQDRTQCADAVNTAMEEMSYESTADPATVALLYLEQDHDYGNGPGYSVAAFDADGRRIDWFSAHGGVFHRGEVPAEFQPRREDLPAYLRERVDAGGNDGFTSMTIDVAAVRAYDWDAAEGRYLTDLAATAARAPRKSPWPESDFERSVYPDWQYEVANGDDPSGFRDWYEKRYGDRQEG